MKTMNQLNICTYHEEWEAQSQEQLNKSWKDSEERFPTSFFELG